MYNRNGYIDKNEHISRYMPLVKKISSIIYKKIHFSMELNEIVQIGTLGLYEAWEKKEHEENLEAYLSMKIKGAILDELRKNDYLTQEDRKLFNQIEQEKQKIINNSNVNIHQEIQKKLNISSEQYHNVLYKEHIFNNLSLDIETENPLPIFANDNIENIFFKKEMLSKIQKEINNLSKNEQIIMQLLYVEELSMQEIAEVMNLTKSRISQIHSNILIILKSKLS